MKSIMRCHTVSIVTDGKNLTLKSESRLFLTKKGLEVTKITIKDEGRYTCRGDNVAGYREQYAFLDVLGM